MIHSVRRWARYATTQGRRASCNSIATVPDVHSATLLACKESYFMWCDPPGINITDAGQLQVASPTKLSTCWLGATWIVVIKSGKESCSCFTVFEKMGIILVTSCNLLPGSKEMTLDPSKGIPYSFLNFSASPRTLHPPCVVSFPLNSNISSSVGWPTKLAATPFDRQTSASKGRIHKT
nr:hypothetical protein Iba_scaffold36172CG0030 [Ipomoea batatas]